MSENETALSYEQIRMKERNKRRNERKKLGKHIKQILQNEDKINKQKKRWYSYR